MKLLTLTLAIALFYSTSIHAAPRDAGGGADAGIQRLLRQLTAERDQLLVEKQDLSKQLDEKDKEVKKLSKKLSGKEDSLGKYKDVNGKLVDRLKLAQEKIVEMNNAYRDLQSQALTLQNDKTSLEANVADQQDQIDRHVENNHRMLEINSELLNRYKKKGFFTLMAKKEPLTQLHKVAIENLIQEYEFELEDLTAPEQKLADQKNP